ncbi:hypothetical protein DCAR_0934267 [Daucus carota subsp. sativus]|uniref:Protein SirB1 N-terminal domain-containing protein n=1 Tax=Daucus carota subsp. sativus TaxID=79200 RepID=A0A175YG29_DAUCS|nr:PREDICTED: uncharacterized protein LOC108201750 isoform X1 [Daucus carota subsp. sativus]WOH14745.1 hypothetical protein DCAR_0934267 [Daucus carota subsp. sativus]
MCSKISSSPWILGTSKLSVYENQTRPYFTHTLATKTKSSTSVNPTICGLESGSDDYKFVLHDALDSSGNNTTHARAARDGFCSQVKKLTVVERETSIATNRRVDLARTALYIAAEDDSLISHSSVPLPVEAFLERLDDLSMGYCSHFGSSFQSSPENFLECMDTYLYINKAFCRHSSKNPSEQRTLYLHSVLTHRLGSAAMLSLVYAEILKMFRIWGILNFDVEIFFPHDSSSNPRGYIKQKSKESDQAHIMTTESLLVKILTELKVAFWPFQLDQDKSLFLRAAEAANCSRRSRNVNESASELASVKAAQHRLERGVWTSVRFGDMRRALSACERLILLNTDPKELRDYSVLLYHSGFYEESLHYLKLYQDAEKSSNSTSDLEKNAVDMLLIRLNLILMEDGWSSPPHIRNFLHNSDPW